MNIQIIQVHKELRTLYAPKNKQLTRAKMAGDCHFDKTQEAGMTPAEIKAAMLKRGITQTEISLVLGKDTSLVGKVINDKSTNLTIRQGVADAIERKLIEVFPDEQYRRASGRICKPSAYFQRAMASA